MVRFAMWIWICIAALELLVICVMAQQMYYDKNLLRWLSTNRCADLQDEAALWEERARHLGWSDEHAA
jgi:hypothetical protein